MIRFPSELELAAMMIMQRHQGTDGLTGMQIIKIGEGQFAKNTMYQVLCRLDAKGLVRVDRRRLGDYAGMTRPTYRLTPIGLDIALLAKEYQ